MKFVDEGKKANFRIFIRELGAISGLEEEVVVEILSSLSTYLEEYKREKEKGK